MANNGLRIPPELVEKILLKLPVKSLLRFSAVSKSWKRMILGSEFATRYRGREMMVLRVAGDEKAFVCPLSSLSIENATPFVLPFTAEPYSGVSCGELRCAEFGDSLCLYNPSTRAHRKLPTPSCATPIGSKAGRFPISAYGLGYDSTANDYKVVKFLREFKQNCEVYSLMSDCWREIRSCMPGHRRVLNPRGVFVDRALHWLTNIAILSFDVSTEKFGEVAIPEVVSKSLRRSSLRSDVCVLRGRVCVCVTNRRKFVVLEYNGCGEWSKDLEIDFTHMYPLCYAPRLHPLYFYDNDGNLVRAVTCCTDVGKIFIYKLDENGHSSLVESKFGGGYGILGSFTYVESLVSPFPLFSNKEEEREIVVEREDADMLVPWRAMFVIADMWEPWRGKSFEPTRRELSLIWRFLLEKDDFVGEEEESRRNKRSQTIKFLRQIRESKGYDVDGDIDFSLFPSRKIFMWRSLDDEKNYSEAMAATKFAIGKINAHMDLMKHDKRYELVSVEKLVSTRSNKLFLTFSAKEIATQDLKTFQAMLCYAKTPPSTFKLKEWKFKPVPIHKL